MSAGRQSGRVERAHVWRRCMVWDEAPTREELEGCVEVGSVPLKAWLIQKDGETM